MPINTDISLSLINKLPVALAVAKVTKHGKVLIESSNTEFQSLWNLDQNFHMKNILLEEFLEILRGKRLLPEQNDFSRFRSHISDLVKSDISSAEDWYLPEGSVLNVKFLPLTLDLRLMIVENLTPKLVLERELRESQINHMAILNHVEDGLAVFGANGCICFYNRAFSRIWGIAEDVLLDSFHLKDFLDATRKLLPIQKNWPDRSAKIVGRLLGRKSYAEQLNFNDGRVLQAKNIPLPDGAVLLRYHDVTNKIELKKSRKERASEVAEYSALAFEAKHLKADFLSNLTLEIENPLREIIGFTELLSSDYFGKLNKRQLEYIENITKVTENLRDLIKKVTELTAIQAGYLECNLESTNLHSKLTEIITSVKERARRKKIALKFECPIDIGYVYVDPKRFTQCLLHVLDNAIRYTNSGGEIAISSVARKGGIEVNIRDTGIGISEVDREQIFVQFDSDQFSKSIKNGIGLGLMLVRSLTELQGGSMKIKSKLNQGTVVSLFMSDSVID